MHKHCCRIRACVFTSKGGVREDEYEIPDDPRDPTAIELIECLAYVKTNTKRPEA